MISKSFHQFLFFLLKKKKGGWGGGGGGEEREAKMALDNEDEMAIK